VNDCELIEDNSSDEEIEESPSQSAVPSSQSETTSQQDPTSATQESGSGAIKCEIISFHSFLRFSMLGVKQIVLRQAVEQPTKPTEITASDLLPLKAARSGVWQCCRIAKHVEYSKKKTRHAEFQRAHCQKCWSDGIDPMKASVTYRDSSQGITSMSNHILNIMQVKSLR
jgi:hypothetical protein